MKTDNLPLSLKVAAAGSAACFADFITFPLDTAKVRLQLQGENSSTNPVINNLKKTALSQSSNSIKKVVKQVEYKGLLGTLVTIATKEGPKSLFNGLSAGLQRQFCFATVRLGMYDTVKTVYHNLIDGNSSQVSILARIGAGMTTGSLAVLIAQPTDVVKVRFQAQLKGGANRYTNTLQAYSRIAKEEGAKGLWKGTATNASRNAIVNVSEIVCYDIIKECIVSHKIMEDRMPCHFTSAVIAGLCATIVASPVDVVKTRYMNSKPGTYNGAINCAVKMFGKEGFAAFYKGFTPSFCRLVSWNIVLWISYEQIKVAINTHLLDNDLEHGSA